jgi:hypothetical protein
MKSWMNHLFAIALLPMSFTLAELYWQIFQDSRDAGSFVLADSPENVVVWVVPLGALVVGCLLYWSYLRRAEGRPASSVLKSIALIGATLTLLLGLLLLDSPQRPLGVSLVTGALALIGLASPIARTKLRVALVGAILALLIAAAWIILAGFSWGS